MYTCMCACSRSCRNDYVAENEHGEPSLHTGNYNILRITIYFVCSYCTSYVVIVLNQ